MKDEYDKRTLELVAPVPAVAALSGGRRNDEPPPRQARPGGVAKPRRLPHQSCKTPPEGAKPAESCLPLGFGRSVLPVSAVARDWGISARRVRVMLAEGRLDGRLLENGYWEVFYPYKYIFGTRGPAIKRQRKPKVLDTPEFMKDHGNGASTRSG